MFYYVWLIVTNKSLLQLIKQLRRANVTKRRTFHCLCPITAAFLHFAKMTHLGFQCSLHFPGLGPPVILYYWWFPWFLLPYAGPCSGIFNKSIWVTSLRRSLVYWVTERESTTTTFRPYPSSSPPATPRSFDAQFLSCFPPTLSNCISNALRNPRWWPLDKEY